jgi:hypothetical protein
MSHRQPRDPFNEESLSLATGQIGQSDAHSPLELVQALIEAYRQDVSADRVEEGARLARLPFRQQRADLPAGTGAHAVAHPIVHLEVDL